MTTELKILNGVLIARTQYIRLKKGRWGNKKGESNQKSKYKERDIKIIRKLHKDGFYSQQEIAEMFEDGQSNISRIILRQRWSHI